MGRRPLTGNKKCKLRLRVEMNSSKDIVNYFLQVVSKSWNFKSLPTQKFNHFNKTKQPYRVIKHLISCCPKLLAKRS